MRDDPIEIITSVNGNETEKDLKAAARENNADEPDYLLRTQLFVCLFIAGILYFTWRQGGELWRELYYALQHILRDGISFSGQEELTRFTDEVHGLLDGIKAAFAPFFP